MCLCSVAACCNCSIVAIMHTEHCHVFPCVIYAEPVVLAPGETIRITAGQKATLQCKVTRSDPRLRITVKWLYNGVPIAPKSSQDIERDSKYYLSVAPPVHSLVIDHVDSNDGGYYKCVVSSVFKEEEASSLVELIGVLQLISSEIWVSQTFFLHDYSDR